MKKLLFITAVAALFPAAPCVQGQTAREQTILNVFGRLNLDVDPSDNLNYWTDGTAFYKGFTYDPNNSEAKPRLNFDVFYLFGGTTHEGGWSITIRLAADGKMTIAADDYTFKKGDRVEYRKVGAETLLLFSDAGTGIVKSVLKKFSGTLRYRYEDDWIAHKDAISLTEENAKAKIVLVKTAEAKSGLPAGIFPLVSTQVMTLTELTRYAGGEPYANPAYHTNFQIMRNEIFARYGHKFAAGGEMAKHFATQTWYKPQFDDVTSKLTEIELINIALIQLLEKKK